MKNTFSSIIAIVLFTLALNSCDNFMNSSGEFREKMSDEVTISKASSVNVSVIAKAGTGEVSKSSVTAKVGIPFEIEFYASENSEFLRWAAFENYDDTKTLDDQLGSAYIQYRKVDNSQEEGAAYAKVAVTIIKDLGQITLVPWCGTRPRVTTTVPVKDATEVVRTTPIKIRFSKAIDESCIATESNPDAYKNYFELYMNQSANTEEEAIDFSDYFDAPVIKSSREIWFNCKAKTDESKWLPAGSVIRFVVKGNLRDADGVRFDTSTSVDFTLGAKGDATGPIVSVGEFKSGTADVHQTTFGNWEPRSGAVEGVHYADTECRVSGNGSFTMKVKADDSTTGDTGLLGFSVIQRLVYVPKGGYLPGTDDETAASDMIPFDEGKIKWNYLSGILESDFKKETIFECTSENTVFEKTFGIDEGFSTTSGKAVDGIYMFEITALDGNSNYASNPSYYYVVRDTTAPDGAVNAAKVKFTDDCGVEVNGKRFFGRNYRTVKFRIDGKIQDFGTAGLPWTACKPEDCRWNVVLSTSNSSLESSNIASDWSSDGSVEIVSDYLTTNCILYAWTKFSDKYGHESTPVCVPELIVCCDNEEPEIPSLVPSDDIYMDVTNPTVTAYVNPNSPKVYFSCSDMDSTELNLQTGVKLSYRFSADTSSAYVTMPVEDGKHVLLVTEEKFGEYVIKARDGVRNETSILRVDVQKNKAPAEITVKNLENYFSKVGGWSSSLQFYDPNCGDQKTMKCYLVKNGTLQFSNNDTAYPVDYENSITLKTIIDGVVYFKDDLYLCFEMKDSGVGNKKVKISDNMKILDYRISRDGIIANSDFVLNRETNEFLYEGMDSAYVYDFKLKISSLNDYGSDEISIVAEDDRTSARISREIFRDNAAPDISLSADRNLSINERKKNGNVRTVSASTNMVLSAIATGGRILYSATDNGIDGVYYRIYDKSTYLASEEDPFSFEGWQYERTLTIPSTQNHGGMYNFLYLNKGNPQRSEDVIYMDPSSTGRTLAINALTGNYVTYKVDAVDALGNVSTIEMRVELDKAAPSLLKIPDTIYSDYNISVSPGSYRRYDYKKRIGAGFTIEDTGFGLDYAFFKVYSQNGSNVVDYIRVTPGEPNYLVDLYSGNTNGTKYEVYMVDKKGNDYDEVFYVKNVDNGNAPTISYYSLVGFGPYDNTVNGYYKDKVRVDFLASADAGLAENGVTFIGADLYQYKSQVAGSEPVLADHFPIAFCENMKNYHYAYMNMKGEEVAIRAEDSYGRVTVSSKRLTRDTTGPRCDYSAANAGTSFMNDSTQSKRIRKLRGDGTNYAGDYVTYTGVSKPEIFVKLDDLAGYGYSENGTDVYFPVGGGVYTDGDGKVGKIERVLGYAYSNDPVWDSAAKRWKLSLEYKNRLYKWYAYDALGNVTTIEFEWR